MQGLGNDFVVIDATTQAVSVTPDLVRAMADRHCGIGCDQVLLLEPSTAADVSYRIFNADGNEVFQCGNGARCVGLYWGNKKNSDASSVCLETKQGLITVARMPDGQVQAEMGCPNFDPESLPFITTQTTLPYQLDVDQESIIFDIVSLGNPHAVVWTDDLDHIDIECIGEVFNDVSAFPEGVNVGFMQRLSADELRLRVYERGGGLTEACGSGACAAVAVGCQRNELSNSVQVFQPGGSLSISWAGGEEPMYMIGPANIVFEGVWAT